MICPQCNTYPVMPLPDRSKPSERIKTSKENQTGFTWLFPTIPGNLCFFCEKSNSGRFDTTPGDFRHGHLVNHHEDNNNHLKEGVN